MLIITVPFKEKKYDSPMGAITEIAPDFGSVQGIKRWGKCVEPKKTGEITVWVECSDQAATELKALAATVHIGDVDTVFTDKDLIKKCDQLIKSKEQ